MSNPISLRDFIVEMAESAAISQIMAIQVYVQYYEQEGETIKIPFQGKFFEIERIGTMPDNMMLPKKFTIEHETDSITLAEGEVEETKEEASRLPFPLSKLFVTGTKGLGKNTGKLKIIAEFEQSGPIESLEILKERANIHHRHQPKITPNQEKQE